MIILLFGLLLFIGIHSLRELKLRDSLIARFGHNAYRGGFSIVAIAGLVLIVIGKSQAAFTMIYEPAFELQIISHMLMLPAIILFVAGVLPRSHLRQLLIHPMLVGTMLWGAAHLWANGDVASVLIFGSIGLWAVVKFVSLTINNLPTHQKPSLGWDVATLVLGLAIFRLITEYHGQLFGIGISIV